MKKSCAETVNNDTLSLFEVHSIDDSNKCFFLKVTDANLAFQRHLLATLTSCSCSYPMVTSETSLRRFFPYYFARMPYVRSVRRRAARRAQVVKS